MCKKNRGAKNFRNFKFLHCALYIVHCTGEPQDLGLPPDRLHCSHCLPEPAGTSLVVKLVSMLLILVEMEVVHMSMEEMTMTVMLLAMWCSYVGSGRALDDSDDGDDAAIAIMLIELR